jgi:hypothetical protein
LAKTSYQTYTAETPIDTYRAEGIRRSAMCAALGERYPALLPVAADANALVAQIDTRSVALQAAEDDQTRARALEDVAKLDVLDVYAELRRTMAAKSYDTLTLLPEAPSALGRVGAKTFGERADQAVANIKALPDADPIKVAFLANLQKELSDFHAADLAEDLTRTTLQGGRVALTLYKSELSQAREAQLGAIQNVLGDREKTAQFTLPWRRTSSKPDASAEDASPPEAPAAPPAPPAK